MTDYIKREDALSTFSNAFYSGLAAKINKIPPVDVAPVRHGEWIHPTEYGLNLPEHYCSECEAWEYSDTESKYCPNCGARMNGEDE